MAINWRVGAIFVGGLALGALAAAVLVGRGDGGERAAAAPPATLPALTAGAPQVDCSFAPIVAKAGPDDGTLRVDKDLQAASSGTISALLLSGKEAAAAGKARDAEAAFLMACRSAEGLTNDPVPLADAQYQLGRHYAQQASLPNAAQRDELLRRAEGLHASSLEAYRRHRGPEHEKTRFAAEGLQRVQQLKEGPVAVPAMAAASAPAAAGDTRVSGAPAQPAAATAKAEPAKVTPPVPTETARAPAAKPQEARPPPQELADAAPPAPAPAAEPAGPTEQELQAQRAEREEREAGERAAREAREARERAREEREEREARRRAREDREAREGQDARERQERAGRPTGTAELGAAPADARRAREAAARVAPEPEVIEPPATATGDIQ